MIRLTETQYAAIGRIAVQSGTLEREAEEYLGRLGKPANHRSTLSTKIKNLQKALSVDPSASMAQAEFDFIFFTINELINKRNALVHGVWSMVTNAPLSLGETTAHGRSSTVRAVETVALAEQLRLARKLLLRLCHEHCAVAAGDRKCPRAESDRLKKQLIRATKIQ